ncbi:MAG TPA: cytochrome-c peroxidase, partial [Saprospiraceae bacterium]|nr:cytochrome-c peroxidase [Saprospiraceae bacterium]
MQIKVIFLFFFGFLTVSQLPLPETKAELGEKLFFDPILSRDSSISCASCHKPHLAFADSLAVSPGIEGRLGRRNAPSVMNMAFRSVFFYDGRAKTIRDQIHFPIQDSVEMDLSYEVAVSRLISNKYYKTAFNLIYKEDP